MWLEKVYIQLDTLKHRQSINYRDDNYQEISPMNCKSLSSELTTSQLLFGSKQCICIPQPFTKKNPKHPQLVHHGLFAIPNCNSGHKLIIKH